MVNCVSPCIRNTRILEMEQTTFAPGDEVRNTLSPGGRVERNVAIFNFTMSPEQRLILEQFRGSGNRTESGTLSSGVLSTALLISSIAVGIMLCCAIFYAIAYCWNQANATFPAASLFPAPARYFVPLKGTVKNMPLNKIVLFDAAKDAFVPRKKPADTKRERSAIDDFDL